MEGTQSSKGCSQKVETRPDPKDARVLVDGVPVGGAQLALPCGRHVLAVAREGYRAVRITFAVLPDVKSTLKFKLKKCEGWDPCPSTPENFERDSAEP